MVWASKIVKPSDRKSALPYDELPLLGRVLLGFVGRAVLGRVALHFAELLGQRDGV